MKSYTKTMFTILTASALVAGSSSAAILIDNDTRNGSFELDGGVQTAAANVYNNNIATIFTTVDDWTPISGGGGLNGLDAAPSSDGAAYAFFSNSGTLENITTHVAQVGDEFNFSWSYNSSVFDNRGNSRLELIAADGTILAEARLTQSLPQFTVLANSYTVTAGDGLEGKAVGVRFVGEGFVEIDEVTLSVVPEPGSLALLGLSGLCVMRRRRG